MPNFETPDPITLYVELGSGTLRVAADAMSTTDIELCPARAGDEDAQALIDEARIDHRGHSIYVVVPDHRRSGLFRRSPDVVVDVRMPTGSSLVVKTKSADVVATGELGTTKIETGSGDIQLADIDGAAVVTSGSGDIKIGTIAGDASIKSASGDVTINTCCSVAKIHTASGDIVVETAEAHVDARSASGDVVIRDADGPVSSRTASGDLQIQRMRGDNVSAVSASGDIQIGVEAGLSVWLDVSSISGTVASSLDPTESQQPDRSTLQLRASTTSGDISIHTA